MRHWLGLEHIVMVPAVVPEHLAGVAAVSPPVADANHRVVRTWVSEQAGEREGEGGGGHTLE